LFKLYILGYFFGIPSERRLFREVEVNLAYRWYLGYDLDEEGTDFRRKYFQGYSRR